MANNFGREIFDYIEISSDRQARFFLTKLKQLLAFAPKLNYF
ncbi:hypothetical protein [Oscillatoria salina]|nr:hypothetical protein [Oscillatoria salina]